MCDNCVLKHLAQLGMNTDEEIAMSKQAIQLAFRICDITMYPEKYGFEEEMCDMNINEDFDKASGGPKGAMADDWNACSPAERLMALGHLRFAMFQRQVLGAAVGEVKPISKPLH